MANDLLSDSETETYDASSIEVLEGLEPVRQRPGMYIGGTDERALHHLVAEVLDNAMDEAIAGHADWIEIMLQADGALTVRDNGRGFPADVERRRMVGHHGLLGMEQRAVALGGKLIIDSMPGGGVTIVVELPPTDAVFNRDDDSASHGSPGPVPASGRGGALV